MHKLSRVCQAGQTRPVLLCCRAGVHARRDPAQLGNFPARLPALLRTPHSLQPRSRPRPRTSRPPVGRAFTPAATLRSLATSRFGCPPFRGHRTPCRRAPPVSAAYLPPTCRADVHARRDPAQPGNRPAHPPPPGLVPHPNTPTRRRHARLHDIHPSQPTIGDHPGKRS